MSAANIFDDRVYPEDEFTAGFVRNVFVQLFLYEPNLPESTVAIYRAKLHEVVDRLSGVDVSAVYELLRPLVVVSPPVNIKEMLDACLA